MGLTWINHYQRVQDFFDLSSHESYQSLYISKNAALTKNVRGITQAKGHVQCMRTGIERLKIGTTYGLQLSHHPKWNLDSTLRCVPKKWFRDVVSDPKVIDFRSVHPIQLGELPMIVTVDLVIKCRIEFGATQHHSQSPDWLLRLPQELGGRAPEVKKLRSGPKRWVSEAGVMPAQTDIRNT